MIVVVMGSDTSTVSVSTPRNELMATVHDHAESADDDEEEDCSARRPCDVAVIVIDTHCDM